MTFQAEGTHIGEIAFAAAFGDGQDVIGIPKRLSVFEPPLGSSGYAGGTTHPFDAAQFGDAINAAEGADAAIALKDPLAQMGGIAAQFPFFDAPIRTERKSSRWNFQVAPTAKRAAIFAGGQLVTIHPAALHSALSAHTQ